MNLAELAEDENKDYIKSLEQKVEQLEKELFETK